MGSVTERTDEARSDVAGEGGAAPRPRSRWFRTGIAASAVATVGMIALGAPALAQGAIGTQPAGQPAILTAFSANSPDSAPSASTTPVDLASAAGQRAASLSAVTDEVTRTQQETALATRTQALGATSQQIEAESERIARLTFHWPTDGGITSPWGMRLHPILRYTRMHGGVDIGGTCGQSIWAAQDGVVTDRSYGSQSGNQLRIDHGDLGGTKVETAYLHISEFKVNVGDRVKRGQVIATVGNTGLSTACHLHFAMYENGVNTDPEKRLP